MAHTKILVSPDGTIDLRLRSAPNGGWVVEESDPNSRATPRMVAAYSTTADLLNGLGAALPHDDADG